MSGKTKATVRIEVFRPGTFTPMQGNAITYSAADIKAVADVYDRETAPAPVVVGHPSIDAPAYAWAEGFEYDTVAQRLYADVGEINPAFAKAVRKGTYKKVSLCFHRPDSPTNPVPGAWYPKHIGFLGGAAPAVTGLRNIQFGSGDDAVTFTADVALPTDFGPAAAPAAAPKATDNVDPAFAAREAAFAAREAKLHERERAIHHKDNADFAEKLISEGRLLPALKDKVVSILDAASDGVTVSFAEGEPNVAMADALRDVLAKQPQVVSFGRSDIGDDPLLTPKQIVVPDGYTTDPTQNELYHRARQIEREKGVSFAEAVDLADGR